MSGYKCSRVGCNKEEWEDGLCIDCLDDLNESDGECHDDDDEEDDA